MLVNDVCIIRGNRSIIALILVQLSIRSAQRWEFENLVGLTAESFLVSKWCPSEAKVGQIWGKSVTLGISRLLSDISYMTLFP